MIIHDSDPKPENFRIRPASHPALHHCSLRLFNICYFHPKPGRIECGSMFRIKGLSVFFLCQCGFVNCEVFQIVWPFFF
jgi:hypothetical protein